MNVCEKRWIRFAPLRKKKFGYTTINHNDVFIVITIFSCTLRRFPNISGQQSFFHPPIILISPFGKRKFLPSGSNSQPKYSHFLAENTTMKDIKFYKGSKSWYKVRTTVCWSALRHHQGGRGSLTLSTHSLLFSRCSAKEFIGCSSTDFSTD